MKSSIISGFLGHILEVHDKALFVFLAPFIAGYFFEGSDSANVILKIYGVMAFSLFFRPMGALFFGKMGDHIGRKSSLLITIFGMSFVTFSIGFIPSYESVGILSSVLIALLRSLQYFFAAGEMTNGGIYLIEHASKKYKGLIGSFFEAATMGAIFLASVETTIFAYFGILETHWQWLFIGAGFLGLVGFWLRKTMEESPEYTSAKEEAVFEWKDLWKYKKALLKLAILTAFSYATYIFSISFINAYLKLVTPLNDLELTSMTTVMTFLDFLALPFFGFLAIYVKDRVVMFIAAFLTLLTAVPLFYVMGNTSSFYEIALARFCLVVLGCSFSALKPLFQQKFFPVKKRCSLLNVSSAIGQLISEGPLTVISLFAINSGFSLMPGFLLSFLGGLAAFVIYRMKDGE